MSEVAPGLLVVDWIQPGTVVVIDEPFRRPGAPEVLVAIHPADWLRIPLEAREEFADGLTSRNAERGQSVLEAWLARRV